MKKTVLLLVVGLWISLCLAASPEGTPVSYKQAFSITAQSDNHMDIRFSLPDFELETVNVGDQVFDRIIMPDAGTTLESGLPELPTVSISLAIPRQGSTQASLMGVEPEMINSFLAYPVQQGQELESPKSFVYNAGYYSQGAAYPQNVVQISEPYILRDFRLVTIQVNPFIYNPLTQALTVNQTIDLRITFTQEPGLNELAGEFSNYSLAFEKIYEASILNFDDYRYQMFSRTPPRYLLIHGNNTDPNFLNAINDFVLWKRQKGADVDVATTAAGSAGTTTTTIKNYIQTAYNNVALRPDYVILVGDTQGSYTIPTFSVSSGSGDYPYTHLEGTDQVGDVFIGRISAENLSQLQTLFAKIYLYERDLNINTADWLNRMLLVGDWSPSGISTVYISKYIKERALYINPSYTFTELYGSDPSPSSMNTAINQGIGFFAYRGYINMSGWSPSESSLNNAFRLPHAIIPTCGTGNFGSSSPGTTEAFIRLGTAAQPKGAVTATGMATSSTHTVFNNVLHGGIWGGLLTYGMRTMGEGLLNAKAYIHQMFGVSSPSNVTSFAHWFNLMGDPTMEVYFGIPSTFNVTTQTTIPLGLSLLDVAVRDNNMTIVADASVTLSQGTSILSRGYTDAEGNVILILPSGMGTGNCVMTVSKHNFKPVQIPITVDTSGTLVPGSIVIDDDTTAPSQGNTDGFANGGETLEILFGLQNTSAATISGISGYITTTSPYATFSDSLVTYAAIPAGQTGFNASPIVLHVAPNTPHNSMLRLHIILTDSMGNTYDISEFMPVTNANIRYHSYALINAGTNNALDPGETAGFTVTLSNIGAIGVTGITARLFSDNDLVSVTNHTIEYGDMLQNVQVTPSVQTFELLARTQVLPGMLIPMRMKLYNAAGFEQWLAFTFTVGVVTVNDPLGPDSYGYVIYDDTDTAYPECPVYDWVGIAPAEGGVGTSLNISDAYTSGDEGDQVGNNPLAVVNLPFPFQFYGISYSQITVASNGFLVFGTTESAEFRNYRLPGPMGPNPMIAPFWDDLATHTGSGIYTWFDRNNHAFVIEWYNLRNGVNGSSPETFQVILYDPAVHAGSLGDGPIKIQYHTFNNVDATSSTSHHGCYSTIGIEDHSGIVGLEYSYSNTYPTAASPLGNGRAIYITNIPIYYEASHLVLGETYITDPNGNGVCEPGELIELGVQLSNIGNAVANNPTATLSTDSEFITMINAETTYFPIAGEGFGVNRTPFRFTVSPDCPNGTVVNFSILIVSGEDSWSRQFSLRVDASQLEYLGFMINDADTNYNGVIEPQESVKLVVNVRNHASVAASDLMATLSNADPAIVIDEPIITKPAIDANDIMQFVFEIFNGGTSTQSEYKGFQFNLTAGNGLPLSATMMVPFNMNNIFSDFETENGNFDSETGWAWGAPSQVTPYSGTKLWASNLSGNYPDLVTYNLHTPIYALQTGSVLSFMHRYGMENNYDGGNISISTDAGNTWNLLTPTGGYSHNSLAGLAGQPGFSGMLANWQPVTINLNQYSNQMAMFRFRMGSDGGTGGIGWFIDNFELSNVNQKTGYLYGVVIPTSTTSPTEAMVKAGNFYTTNPDQEGNFKLFLPNGTHSVTATLDYHQSSSIHNIVIGPNDPTHYTEFTLINLPKPVGIDFDVDNDSGLMSLTWNEPYDPVLPVMAYKVYKRFNTGPFEFVQETTSTNYSETLELEGDYKYYVTVRYLNTDGTPSDLVAFSYPFVDSDDNNNPGLVTKLNHNYPNPFNPSTTIAFDLAKAGNVKLSVYNVKGQLVRRLTHANLPGGSHRVTWNGVDESNRPVASGIYYYRLETRDYTKTNKMLLMK